MPNFCSSCGSPLEADMSYCPDCGTGIDLENPGMPAQAGHLPAHPAAYPAAYPPAPMPYPQPFPAYPYPYPYAYRPPTTAKRAATIAAGILVLIDGCLAFLLGFAFLFGWEAAIGISLFIGFGLSIAASVSAFTCSHIWLAVVGPVVLLGAALLVMTVDEFLVIIGMIGGAMAAVSLGLVIYGWSDTKMRSDMKPRRNQMPVQQYSPPPHVDPSGYGDPQDGVTLNLRR